MVEGIEIIPVASLAQAVGFLTGEIEIEPQPSRLDELFRTFSTYEVDFADVRGQEMAKRALTVAASRRAQHPDARPARLGQDDAGQADADHPARPDARRVDRNHADLQRRGPLEARPAAAWPSARSARRTTRSATPAWSAAARRPRPAKSRLAHNGVLFLDELPEFNRQTLEVLRQPLEDGTVTISRALNSTTFPANFMLIAALNPCPCGYRGDSRRSCHCTPPQIERYMSKIHGPLLDRIDIHIEVPSVAFRELSGGTPGTSSDGDAPAGGRRPRRAGGPLQRRPAPATTPT